MRYFRKRDLIQNLLSTKLIKFDFQYHYVSLYAKYNLEQVPLQVPINLLWISITVLSKY